MGWNDHHPGIDPDDPDPGETLRAMADEIRDREKYEPPEDPRIARAEMERDEPGDPDEADRQAEREADRYR